MLHWQVVLLVFFGNLFMVSANNVSFRYFPEGLTNMHMDGDMYVAGNGTLYKLNKDLKVLVSISTCSGHLSAPCRNENKVLLVNSNRNILITCGTGNDGVCEFRKLDDPKTVIQAKQTERINVSTDVNRPAKAILTQGEIITFSITFGEGLLVHVYRRYTTAMSYKFPISSYAFDNDKGYVLNKSLVLSLPSVNQFLIYYKALFQYGGFLYFLTNQKNLVGESKNVTKLVRICQNDSMFETYVDVVLECAKDGEDYNLLQDAVVLDVASATGNRQGDILFVATFTRSEDPEAVSGDSAVCIAKLQELDQAVTNARNKAIFCPGSNITGNQRYLARNWIRCLTAPSEALSACEFNSFYYHVIGETPYSMSPLFELPASGGHITKVAGHVTVDTNRIVVLAGTSRGYLLKLEVFNNGQSLRKFDFLSIHRGFPVHAVHISGQDLFIMTNYRLTKVPVANCSRFETCESVMNGQSPYCGWCVYRERSTRKSECQVYGSNHWLPSNESCMDIEPFPAGLPVGNDVTQINLTVNPFPDNLERYNYTCKFRNKPPANTYLGHSGARRIGDTVVCDSIAKTSHGKLDVELWVGSNSFEFLLGSTDFLFFDCIYYKQCGGCTATRGANCIWCASSLICTSQISQCTGDSVTHQSSCPRLEDNRNRFYIPNDVAFPVSLSATNLREGLNYYCKFPDVDNKRWKATLFDHTITCTPTLHIPDKISKKTIGLSVVQEHNGIFAALDDNFSQTVTIYRCEKLGRDCSHCRGLNHTRYTCDWCNPGACGYDGGTGCDVITTCPKLKISSIVPADGPTRGGTLVTIYGSELGLYSHDIEAVTLGTSSCKIQPDFNESKGDDFGIAVPNQVVCYVNQQYQQHQQSVYVSMKLNGITYNSSRPIFTFKVPVVTSITPTYGPVSGGTRVTFTGENLGIGNKLVRVRFKNVVVPLEDCEATDNCTSSSCSDHSNPSGANTNYMYVVLCTTPASSSWNVTSVSVAYDNIIGYQYQVVYNFVRDPEIQRISRNKGIVSGGLPIKVEGKYLTNANCAVIIALYNGAQTTGTCEALKSSKAVICIAPPSPNDVITDMTSQMTHGETPSIPVTIVVKLDGVEKGFEFEIFQNPEIYSFGGDNNVVSYDTFLEIKGQNLNIVAKNNDVHVTVGVEECHVVNLSITSMTCLTPKHRPEPGIYGLEHPEVNVSIGYVRKTVGYVRYEDEVDTRLIIIVSVSTASAVLLIAGVVIFVVICKRKQVQIDALRTWINRVEMAKMSRKED